jgi:hypothetical protein
MRHFTRPGRSVEGHGPGLAFLPQNRLCHEARVRVSVEIYDHRESHSGLVRKAFAFPVGITVRIQPWNRARLHSGTLFAILPECRSCLLQNQRSPSLESLMNARPPCAQDSFRHFAETVYFHMLRFQAVVANLLRLVESCGTRRHWTTTNSSTAEV